MCFDSAIFEGQTVGYKKHIMIQTTQIVFLR